jgi:predicted RNase H-like HicB family nuclease
MKAVEKGLSINLSVNIVVRKDGDGYYATCPSFKGLHVFGVTRGEALKHASDAVVAYSLSFIKHNEPIPCDNIIKEKTFIVPELPLLSLKKSFHLNISKRLPIDGSYGQPNKRGDEKTSSC